MSNILEAIRELNEARDTSNYPDVVTGFFYRKNTDVSGWSHPLCVYFPKAKKEDIPEPFELRIVSDLSVKKGSRACFLTKADADACHLGSNTFLAKEKVTAVRIDIGADIPVYAEIEWVKHFAARGWVNDVIVERMSKAPVNNPFADASQEKADANAVKRAAELAKINADEIKQQLVDKYDGSIRHGDVVIPAASLTGSSDYSGSMSIHLTKYAYAIYVELKKICSVSMVEKFSKVFDTIASSKGEQYSLTLFKQVTQDLTTFLRRDLSDNFSNTDSGMWVLYGNKAVLESYVETLDGLKLNITSNSFLWGGTGFTIRIARSPKKLISFEDIVNTIDALHLKEFAAKDFKGTVYNTIEAYIDKELNHFIDNAEKLAYIDASDIPQFNRSGLKGNITPKLEEEFENYLIDNYSQQLRSNDIASILVVEEHKPWGERKYDASLFYCYFLKTYGINIFKAQKIDFSILAHGQLTFNHYYPEVELPKEVLENADSAIVIASGPLFKIPEGVTDIKCSIHDLGTCNLLLPASYKSNIEYANDNLTNLTYDNYGEGNRIQTNLIFTPVSGKSPFQISEMLLDQLKQNNKIFKL